VETLHDNWKIKELKILVKSEKDGYENSAYNLNDRQITSVMQIAQKRITPLPPIKTADGVFEDREFYPLVELYKYLRNLYWQMTYNFFT
jgi:hypothetical protein